MAAELTDPENQLIEKAATGEPAIYATGDSSQDDSRNGASWDAGRTLRAEVVRRLCLSLNPEWKIDPKGIRIIGAKIDGELNLNFATMAFPLQMNGCHFAERIDLTDAIAKRLSFSGSCLCKGLTADGITVKGGVFLNNHFSAKGEVRLLGANIGGILDCSMGSFENPGGDALSADGITVKGSVFLNNHFSAKGAVRLLGADIRGILACGTGSFENPGGDALSADRISVKGGVFLDDGFSAKGEVRLLGADIGGDLTCGTGSFENPGGDALSVDGITVKGDIFLNDGFSAKGEVRLLGADIGGDLACRTGTFENPGGKALSADRITVKGGVFLNNRFSAKGAVRLPGANIGGNLACISARLEAKQQANNSEKTIAFDLHAARVVGVFMWRDLKIHGKVTFAHARVGVLLDESDSWPECGALDLSGFEYGEFADLAPATASDRIDWLQRQEPFRPQPYEQAIRVLRRMGHDRDAREIAIAKQVALRESGSLSRWGQRWNRFFEITVAYGYKPWKALWFVFGFWIIGMAVFDAGFSTGQMSPTDSRVFLHPEFVQSKGDWLPPEYPRFKAPIYSLDVFLPIVDLHQESRWLPNMRNGWGWAVWCYMWVHILAGWVLTSVFVGALTGVIKKD